MYCSFVKVAFIFSPTRSSPHVLQSFQDVLSVTQSSEWAYQCEVFGWFPRLCQFLVKVFSVGIEFLLRRSWPDCRAFLSTRGGVLWRAGFPLCLGWPKRWCSCGFCYWLFTLSVLFGFCTFCLFSSAQHRDGILSYSQSLSGFILSLALTPDYPVFISRLLAWRNLITIGFRTGEPQGSKWICMRRVISQLIEHI